MNNLENLRALLNDLVDYEYDNMYLQWEILSHGFSTEVKMYDRLPKLSMFVANKLNLKDSDVHFLPTYKSSLEKFRHSKNYAVLLFADDNFEISLFHPDMPNLKSMIFSGHYLQNTLKQGIGGVIPQILKHSLGRTVGKDEALQALTFKLTIKALLPENNEVVRANFLKQMKMRSTVNANGKKMMEPKNLFERLSHHKFTNETKYIINERLKLWGMTLPEKITSTDFFTKMVPQLPLNFFDISDLYKMDCISHNFHQPISNQTLLSGELGHFNIYQYQRITQLNQKLQQFFTK